MRLESTVVVIGDTHFKDSLEGILLALADCLEKKRAEIGEEISGYPPPIPACDAQFNYLLEARRGIARELAQLKELEAEGPGNAERRQSIRRLIKDSAYLDNSAKQNLQARLARAQ